MDTKSKNIKKKVLLNIVVLIMIITSALGMIYTYPMIEKKVNERENYSPFEMMNFVNDIYDSSYVIYKDMMEEKEGKTIYPEALFIKPRDVSYGDKTNYNREGDNTEKAIRRDFDSSANKLKYSLKNLEYYASFKDGSFVKANSGNDIKKYIQSKELTDEEIENLKKDYLFYVNLSFDEEGEIKVNNSIGANQYTMQQKLDNEVLKNLNSYEYTPYELNPIKNIDIIYAVPRNLKYNDNITMSIHSLEYMDYRNSSSMFILTIGIIVLFLALLVPYRLGKEFIGFKALSKIPFEFNVLIAMLVVTAFIGMSPEIIIMNTINGSFTELVRESFSMYMSDIIVYLANVIYYVIIFAFIFLEITMIKYIFHEGIRKYFREKFLLLAILRWIKNGFRKVFDSIRNVDLRDNQNKKLLKIVLINFVAVTIMCSTWFFGIIGAVIYSFILFKILKKYIEDVSEKYKKLLKVTNEIAKGNLDVKIEDDLGVFEPFKEEVSKIQNGFKNAVDEEVKSQKMKTELISNVSHDLKTPLTSIITYIDLLKDQNINEETRKLYIDTLDRKSQRLKDLIEDLFEVSKATSGNISLNIMNVDIVSLMKQVQIELSDKIEESTLTFKNNYPDHKVMLLLDSQRTFRVFENLIVNALKYSMDNSRVYISIIEDESEVKITLKNMSYAEIDFNIDEIAERFVRGDKSRNTEGSGLGLAIAKSFVELQGGKFNIDIDGDLFKVTISFLKK
ncbi:sensor histidine kinase [Clostridium cadaveris]|uniref:sensor histidine kinase n=1 Tax=Clostridium cadaveris TaxID=1529 RepID=UPI001E54FAA3|nr:sensor histidine kinase [Clostridium cadaveris]